MYSLRHSSAGVMWTWMASLSNSSLEYLATHVSHGMSLWANNSCTDTAHLCTISHPCMHALSIGMLSIYSITLLVMHRLLSAHQVLQWLLGLIIAECQ